MVPNYRMHGYDIETKAQLFQWKNPKEPRPKKACRIRSNLKVSLTVFFDCNSVGKYVGVVAPIAQVHLSTHSGPLWCYGWTQYLYSLNSAKIREEGEVGQRKSCTMESCIMNSCHKVVRSISNTTLKLCAKQFLRNAQNCGKTKHRVCTMQLFCCALTVIMEIRPNRHQAIILSCVNSDHGSKAFDGFFYKSGVDLIWPAQFVQTDIVLK